MKIVLAIMCVALMTCGCNMLASDGLPTLGKATTIEQETRGQESSQDAAPMPPMQTSQMK